MTHPLELVHPRNLKHLSHTLQGLVASRLWAKVLLGMVLGIGTGLALGPAAGLVERDTAELISSWLVLPGNIFLTIIQMIVVPLVLASVVRGIAASGSTEQLRTTGLRLVVYFLFTTTVAITIGIVVASIIQPGQYVDNSEFAPSEQRSDSIEENIAGDSLDFAELPNALVSILPDNPFSAAVEMNMLQIVLFSIIFGLALVSLKPEKSKPLLDLLGSLQSVVMKVVSWVMRLAPYAVFGFIAQVTMQTGLATLYGIGIYVLTVLAGLATLMLFYLCLVGLVGRMSPWRFLAAVRQVQLLAFSTNSSVAVMPLTMKTAEEKLGVRPSTAQFIVPIGATVNMDGTALFHGAATLFLTQVYGLEVGMGMLLALVATAIGASIGTPATPGVGIIILSVVLTSVGVPVEGIALLVGVDRVLELFRTATNVTGDLTASVVIDRFVRGPQSYADEVVAQSEIERQQEEQDEDVLTGEYTAESTKKPGIWDRLGHWLKHDSVDTF
jgi:Na+/H+-dicarboxylate symporter